MAECGWKGPFDTPCHFTKGHGSAHSQMGGSEDDRYGWDSRSRHRLFSTRLSGDTRTKEQKLEAMANQTASPHEAEVARRKLAEHRASHQPGSHPIFKRRGDDFGIDFGINTNDKRTDPKGMGHEDFMDWLHRAQSHRGDPKPHIYTASRGDALGCDTCARSKDNPRAHHVKGLGG